MPGASVLLIGPLRLNGSACSVCIRSDGASGRGWLIALREPRGAAIHGGTAVSLPNSGWVPTFPPLRPALRLVRGPDECSRSPRRSTRDLIAAPFRPGELPTAVVVRLGTDAQSELSRIASENRLPVAMSLRIVVEAVRARECVSAATGLSDVDIEDALSRAATQSKLDGPRVGGSLGAYVAALKAGQFGGGATHEVVLRLSTEMVSSWAHSAAASGQSLDAWVQSCLLRAPACAAAWEIAAVSEGCTLAEWTYASALSSPGLLASIRA